MGFNKDIVARYNEARQCQNKTLLCHAPSTSLYFGRDGNISACCYSRSNPLGSYPKHSIADIWSGVAAKKMRSEMRKNSLPKGCELCADQLTAENFNGLLAGNFDHFADSEKSVFKQRIKALLKKGKFEYYPKVMEFELSNTCNLECDMCTGFFSSSIRRNRENLPPLQDLYDDAFVEQLKPFIPHLREAKFLGGEPFLIDVYFKIWELFIELNPTCLISITTNGTVMNARVRRVVEKLNCIIIVSIDAVTKETYEKIRVNAVFERTFANLDFFIALNSQKQQETNITACPMTSNWHELPLLMRFANDKGLKLYFNTVVYPKEMSFKYMTLKTLREVHQYLLDSVEEATLPIPKNNFGVMADLCHQIDFWIKEKSQIQEEQIKEACEHYLEGQPFKDHQFLKAILQVIITPDSQITPALITINLSGLADGDSKKFVIEYMNAIWCVARQLQKDSLLTGLDFSNDKLNGITNSLSLGSDDAALQGIVKIFKESHPVELARTMGGSSLSVLLSQMTQMYNTYA